jgi:predicted permease
MLALGYIIRQAKLVDEKGFVQLNALTFRVFLPLLIFRNIYTSDLSAAFNGRYILWGVIITVVSFLLSMLAVCAIEKENRKRGVLVQGIFRSNFIIFGLSVATNMYGGERVAPISMMITFIVPLYNVLSVIALEFFRGGAGKINIKAILRSIATNPLIIASILGVLLLLSGLRFPKVAENTLKDITSVATPLALVALGGSIRFAQAASNIKGLLIGILGRLVVTPALFIPAGVLLGFRDVELIGLLMMLASPTAVSSYTMAQQMGGDGELAGELVVFGTACSVGTIFLWVFLLTSLNLA